MEELNICMLFILSNQHTAQPVYQPTPSLNRSELLQTFISRKLLGEKSSNFQCRLVICCGFVVPNLNFEVLSVASQHNIEKTIIVNAKSTFCDVLFGRSCL